MEPLSPFGGFKQSGIGREYGFYGLEAFLEPRAVMA
jgi:aldehyde dehydrogenase (NAD+)